MSRLHRPYPHWPQPTQGANWVASFALALLWTLPAPSQPREKKPRPEGHPPAQSAQHPSKPTASPRGASPGGQHASPPPRTSAQVQDWQNQKGWVQNDSWQGHDSWPNSRARQWENEHRTWPQRGGYGGFLIPQAMYRTTFGQRHLFRLRTRPTIFLGFPRFQYGGFSFLLVDPWPESWPEDWYSAEELYIEWNNGYYLHHRGHPTIALAIAVMR